MYFLLVLLYNSSVYHDIHECIEVRRDYKMPCYNCKTSWKLSTTLRYKYRFIWPYPLTIGGILSAALHIQLKKTSKSGVAIRLEWKLPASYNRLCNNYTDLACIMVAVRAVSNHKFLTTLVHTWFPTFCASWIIKLYLQEMQYIS